MYVTVYSICIGLVDLRGTQSKQELQYENLLLKVVFDPVYDDSGDNNTSYFQ